MQRNLEPPRVKVSRIDLATEGGAHVALSKGDRVSSAKAGGAYALKAPKKKQK
jgi:hypothetical protein